MTRIRASECPAIQKSDTFLSLALAESTPGGNAPTARNFQQGMTSEVPGYLNRNATQLDLVARYGGPGKAHAVALGLELSASSGLILSISPGHALIGGIVELAIPATMTLPASSRCWLWLTQGGSLTYQVGSLEPPVSSPCCLLGSCLTDATSIQEIDTSGVVYLVGGMLWRASGDRGEPDDSPPSDLVFLHRSLSGSYLWDGSRYVELGPPVVSVLAEFQELTSRIDYLQLIVAQLLRTLMEQGVEGIETQEELLEFLDNSA